eukprot:5882178-Amphidinium_carterae.1
MVQVLHHSTDPQKRTAARHKHVWSIIILLNLALRSDTHCLRGGLAREPLEDAGVGNGMESHDNSVVWIYLNATLNVTLHAIPFVDISVRTHFTVLLLHLPDLCCTRPTTRRPSTRSSITHRNRATYDSSCEDTILVILLLLLRP